jgi:hypothetical protein
MIKSKEIEFWLKYDYLKEIVDFPVPASTMIPKWYKDVPRFVNSDKPMISDEGAVNTGVKTCAPFLDALTFGYIVKLHCDVMVEEINGENRITWASKQSPLSGRPKSAADQLPKVPGYGPFTQAWELQTGFKTPKGYSVLITQPFNRQDLNTFITTGIIDCDDYLGPGGIPFAIREGFTGIIKEGTPIAQMIPFKRDSWKSTVVDNKFPFGDQRGRKKIMGWYKENIWKKKEFK